MKNVWFKKGSVCGIIVLIILASVVLSIAKNVNEKQSIPTSSGNWFTVSGAIVDTINQYWNSSKNGSLRLPMDKGPSSASVTTGSVTNIGNTNATLTMNITTGNWSSCSAWFDCTENFNPLTSGTGSTFTQKWATYVDCALNALAVTKDTNSDGILEIFIAGANSSSNGTRAYVECLNGSSGKIIWQANFSDSYLDVHLPLSIGDLNDDGKFELICPGQERTRAFYCDNGSMMWNVSVYSGWHHTLILDVDRNGKPYVYVAAHDAGHNISKLYGKNGTVKSRVTHTGSCYGGLSAADCNGDGTMEIFASDAGRFRCFNSNLTNLWNYAIVDSSTCVGLADMNNDGRLEAISTSSGDLSCDIAVVNCSNGKAISRDDNTGVGGHLTPAIFDFDKDGHLELASGYYTSHAKVWDLTARSIEFDAGSDHTANPPVFANVMGDNDLEMLVLNMLASNNLSIYNSSYKYQTKIDTATWNEQVLDYDGDGYNEILMFMHNDENNTDLLKCYDTQAYAPLPRARGDTTYYSERRLNTALYVPEPNRIHTKGHTTGIYSYTLYGLTPGTVYYSQAFINNTAKEVRNGSKVLFLTKPNAAEKISSTAIGKTYMVFSWPKGTGATTTYIERNTNANWIRGTGTFVYNGTGTTYNNTGLSPGTTYYYRTWSYTKKQGLKQYSTTSSLFSGTTATSGGTPSNEYPINAATMVERPPTHLSVQVNDSEAVSMDIFIRWRNHQGAWITLESFQMVGNGTYSYDLLGNEWIWGNTIYTWSINVTDGTYWTNTTYSYTTKGSRYDVNNDNKVNFQDAGLVWTYRTSLVLYDGLYDVNGDDQVNFQDAGLTWVYRD